MKVYDPYVKREITENQYHSLEKFLKEIDIVVILVAHDEIKEKQELLKNKIVFDTKNSLSFNGIIKL